MEKLDLREWLEMNRERLVTYTVDEIADVAIASGYSLEDVSHWVTKTRWDRRVA